MPRPSRCRRICREPEYDGFCPKRGGSGEVLLTLDEYEAIRLLDLLGMTQEQCAGQMDISRTTVAEIYEKARYKLADALVNGKSLRVSGGNYRLCGGFESCPGRNPSRQIQKGESKMKVAVTYENGTVFQHFGHTAQFKLYQVENGKVVSSQVVDTAGSGHGALAGFLKENGVDTLICGGIGGGARTALEQAGITLYGGVSGSADRAVENLLSGVLAFDPMVQCSHHAGSHSCGEHGCGEAKHGCAGNGGSCHE